MALLPDIFSPPRYDCRYSSICAALRSLFVFFQAEAGIRDATVTGVQTCALPIFSSLALIASELTGSCRWPATVSRRSEERRGGKEGRSRWSPDPLKKKKTEEGKMDKPADTRAGAQNVSHTRQLG